VIKKNKAIQTKLIIAICREDAPRIARALKLGVKLNLTSALTVATLRGYTKGVDILLAHGVDINAVDEDGWPVICWAIWGRNIALVQHLIDLGANTEFVDKTGQTLVQLAEHMEVPEIVRILQCKGKKQ
jgi:ankyrin repeat protein